MVPDVPSDDEMFRQVRERERVRAQLCPPNYTALQKHIATILEKYDPTLGHIQLTGCDVDGEIMKWVAPRLRSLPSLKTLEIDDEVALNGEAIEALATGIGDWLTGLVLECGRGLLPNDFGSLGKFKRLRRLNVTGTTIGDIGLKAIVIGMSRTLTEVTFSSCHWLQSSDFALLGRLPSIQRLSLENTKLDRRGLTAIVAELRNSLITLNLSSCQKLKAKDFDLMIGLSKLEKLYLDYTWIDGHALSLLVEPLCSTITTLSLTGCDDIESPDFDSLAKFSKLQKLWLNDTLIEGSCLADIVGGVHNRLQMLDLTNCKKLSGADFACLGRLTNLRVLSLSETAIDDAALGLFSRTLTSLEELDISSTSIDDAGVLAELLRSLLPAKVGGGALTRIDVSENTIRWATNNVQIPDEVLEEHDPLKLLILLIGIRDSDKGVVAARAVTAGVSGSGKTHLRRRLTEPESEELCRPLGLDAQEHEAGNGRFTVGVFHRETLLTKQQHGCEDLPNLSLTVVDVGGHREQLRSHHHYVFLSGPSLFLLCLHSRRPFDGWGRYYLELMQELTRLRLSKQYQQPFSVDNFRGLIKPNEKSPVIIIPTHRDIAETISDLKLPNNLSDDFPLLEIVVAPGVNNLDPTDAGEVRKCIGTQLNRISAVRLPVLGYVIPVRNEVRKTFGLSEYSAADLGEPPAWMEFEEFEKICIKYNAGNVDYVVRTLLRLGDVTARLADVPGEHDLVSTRLERLLNPRFVSKYLYRVVTDIEAKRERGFMTVKRFREITGEMRSDERELLREMLKEYLVVVRYEKFAQEAGFFIPDLFESRPLGQFEPWDDAIFDEAVTAREFVPEHTFFEFLTYCEKQDWLVPIDKRKSVYLFRDACLLTDGLVEAQVFADVLQRKFRVIARGPVEEAVEMGQTLWRWFNVTTNAQLRPPQENHSGRLPTRASDDSNLQHLVAEAIQKAKLADAERAWNAIAIEERSLCQHILQIVGNSSKESPVTTKTVVSQTKKIIGWERNAINIRIGKLREANLIVTGVGYQLKLTELGMLLIAQWRIAPPG